MSCWVAVSVAGEYLGLSSTEIVSQVQQGRLASRYELGMLMVDVRPDTTPAQRERQARVFPSNLPGLKLAGDRRGFIEERVVEQIDDPDFIEHDRFTDWRIARARTSRERRAPALAA